MFPHPNPLKARLAADQVIAGFYIQTASPDNVEMAAQAGYDYVIIDQEHGSFDLGATLHMIRAAEANGARVVRTRRAGQRKGAEATGEVSWRGPTTTSWL